MSICTEYTTKPYNMELLSDYSIFKEDKIGEYTSFCIQQNNKPDHKNNDYLLYDMDKDILIEQATNRLRQKVLENKLKSFISSLVEIKSQLEIIKLETSISLQLLPTSSDTIMTETQLEHFEKRFASHVESLNSLIPPTKEDTVESTELSSVSTPSIQSNIISHISSVFSAYNEDPEDVMESDYSILGDYDHKKRVSKRKKLYRHQNEILSPTPSICDKEEDDKSEQDRNAFDDVLSYINNNADDIEFRKELSQLLDSPLFTQEEQRKGIVRSMVSTSIKWIRFTIVMFLAILINLKRGRSSFLGKDPYINSKKIGHYMAYHYPYLK